MNKKKGKFKWTMLHYIMLRRSMGILLVVVMVFSTLPVSSFAVFASENRNAGLCEHHTEHDADCGFVPKSEDGEGSPCTYECRICPVEDLIADLPDKVTEDNAEDVRTQLDEILDLYRELTEDEQGQLDLSRVTALQGALDAANAPMAAAETINVTNATNVTLIAEDGGCQGHTFTGTAEGAIIYVESGTHDVTFSNLKITGTANVGVAPNATMNLAIDGTNTIHAGSNLAGIYVPVGATLVINGTGSLNVSGNGGGAGIGGAAYAPDEDESNGDPNCGTVEIKGGTVTATGGNLCAAGIGGGTTTDVPGNGGDITINGGTVTATGGSDGYYSGAGIGGGSVNDGLSSGSGGTLTINGGNVTLKAGQYDPQWSTAYDFGRGSGDVSGGTCELTLADASYLTANSLDPNGKYTINGDPTEDMIVVPELVYTGEVLDTSGIKIDDSKTGTGTYFGQTFTVKASADGWTYTINPSEVKAAGDYTVTFSKEGHTSISKTFTVAKSGTDLKTEGKVKTYNGSEETTSFSADDTITVKATPTATGKAPQKAAARLRGGYTEPTTGQMALFVGDIQVSDPVGAGEGGTYTMTVSASEVLLQGNAEPNGNAITLTAKFVGNDNMADAAGTVDVRISAVAMAERDGEVIGYFGVSNFEGTNNLFCKEAYADATITLLGDVKPGTNSDAGTTCSTMVDITCTLDLAGHNFASTDTAIYVLPRGNLTIQDSSTGKTGNVSFIKSDGTLTLYGGTFGKIETAYTLSSLLAENCAYYRGSTPIPLSELEGQKTLDGTVTVQECQHKDVTPTSNNDGTHTLRCPYCGYTKAAEDCDYGEYTHNDTSHTRICKLCGYQNVEAHNIKCTAEASGTVIAVSEACKTCGYGKDLGIVTIHIPKLVYGDLTGVITAETTLTETVVVDVWVDNNPSGVTVIFPFDPPTMATLTGNALLSAGEHKIKINIVIIRDENALAECELTFNVDPAPLTADMVTLSAESTTYSGIEQKPTVTVAGLTEGTDYAVSYTRDGTITTDFTSAGTVTITITGTGNYQGEVVKTFTIKKAKPSLSVGKAEITYGEALYESALTAKAQDDSKKEIVGTFTWKDRFVKPAVSDSGKTKYTLVFTPKDEKNYDSVETEVTLTVNKAKNPPKKPGSKMNVSVNCSKVSDIALPEGWKWQDSDMNTALTAGEPITAAAEYTGTDSENYEKTTADVEIIRSECSHVPGDFLYTKEGEKEPTCTKEGLGHRECTVCHEVIESEAAVPALGHDYTETVTEEPTTEHEGVKTYTCSRCHDEYTESIPKLTGGGSAGGGASAGGNGTVVTPEVPDTFTETVTKTNSAGKTVVVTTTIKYGSNQSIISKTVKSVIEQAAVNTAVTVTVKTDKNGKTTASATVVKTKTAAEKETKNTISAAVVSQIIEAAGTADVMITWKVKDAGGKTKYTIKVNAKDVKNGSVLKIMKIDPKTGEYILVNAKNYPVTKNGNVSVTVDKKGTYILLNEADAKKYSDAIKKSIKVKDALKSVKAGQKTSIALNGKTNKENIKKITYTSTDKSIASVDKKGRITAKKKGTVTIKAKVTLKNGVTKTVKMKVKVK